MKNRCEPQPSRSAFRPRRVLFAACCCCVLIAARPVRAQGGSGSPAESVSFTKEFPGSQPDYYSLKISPDGQAQYRADPGDDPISLQLSTQSTNQIFELVRKLNYLQNAQFESKHRVANMGKKTVEYQSASAHATVSFNHTEIPDAQALSGMFEKISATMQHELRLEYLMRHDKLGVVDELLQLEIQLDEHDLLEPELLLPVLQKVQQDQHLVNIAQERAARIIGKIQSAGKESASLP